MAPLAILIPHDEMREWEYYIDEDFGYVPTSSFMQVYSK